MSKPPGWLDVIFLLVVFSKSSIAIGKLLAGAGKEVGFTFLVHPHLLWHATGYKLANDAQDTRAIQHEPTLPQSG